MKLILISILQSVLLCGGQVLLKFAIKRMGEFSMTWKFFCSQIDNWWFLGCGICYAAATVLWMYIIKNFPFSMAYPMISISYVLGMLAAIFIFHESVPLTRWIGVLFIILGCFFVAK